MESPPQVFEDEDMDVIVISKSSSNTEKCDQGTDTSEIIIEYKDQASQAVVKQPMDTQTELDFDPNNSIIIELKDLTGDPSCRESVQEIAQLLLHTAPLVEEQLLKNNLSRAFDEYQVSWEEDREAITLVHQIRNDFELMESNGQKKKSEKKSALAAAEATQSKSTTLGGDEDTDDVVKQPLATSASQVAWNCNGSLLAVAYARNDHVGWCIHRATLCVYNMMKQTVDSKPDVSIELPCCLMCIAFHPEDQSIIAGGLFNGEIRIWDVSKGMEDAGDDESASSTTGDPLLMTSPIDDYMHREPISKLTWVRNTSAGRSRSYQLVSVSGDGKVLFWDLANKLSYWIEGAVLKPTEHYFGQNTGRKGGGGGGTASDGLGDDEDPLSFGSSSSVSSAIINSRYPIIGGTSIAFSPLDWSSYVVGTECGGVLRCLVNTKLRLRNKGIKSGEFKWSADAYRILENSPVRNDIKRVVEKYAQLNHVDIIRPADLFASMLSVNLKSHTGSPVWTTLFPPAHQFSFQSHSGPIYGMAFSPFHRNVFLTCSTDGSIHLFNSLKQKPIHYFEMGSHAYLYDIAWSPSRPLVFAAVDGDGKLYIFDLLQSTEFPALVQNVGGDASSSSRNTSSSPFSAVSPSSSSLGSSSNVSSSSSSTSRVPLSSLSFNPKNASIVSVVDVDGRISVWQLSAHYSSLQSGEIGAIEQLGAVTD